MDRRTAGEREKSYLVIKSPFGPLQFYLRAKTYHLNTRVATKKAASL